MNSRRETLWILLGLLNACTGALQWKSHSGNTFLIKAPSIPNGEELSGDDTVTFNGRCTPRIPVVVTGEVYFRSAIDGHVLSNPDGTVLRESFLSCSDSGTISNDLKAADGTAVLVHIDDASTSAELDSRERGGTTTDLRKIEIFQRDHDGVTSPSFVYSFKSNVCKNITQSQALTIGTGSAADPYRICTEDQFWKAQALSEANTSHENTLEFRLKQDLDLGNYVYFYNSASDRFTVNSVNVGEFYDHFDGENRKISNFNVTGIKSYFSVIPPARISIGLFGNLYEGASIKNLRLNHCVLDFGDWGDGDYSSRPFTHAGCLAGNIFSGTRTPVTLSRIQMANPDIQGPIVENSNLDDTSFYGALAGWVGAVSNVGITQTPVVTSIYIDHPTFAMNSGIGCLFGGIFARTQTASIAKSTPLRAEKISCINPEISADHNAGFFAGVAEITLQLKDGAFGVFGASSPSKLYRPVGAATYTLPEDHEIADFGGVAGQYGSALAQRASPADKTSIDNVEIALNVIDDTGTNIAQVGGIFGTWEPFEYDALINRVSVTLGGGSVLLTPLVGIGQFGGVSGYLAAAAGNVNMSIGAFSFFSNIGSVASQFSVATIISSGYLSFFSRTSGFFFGSYNGVGTAGLNLTTSTGSFFSSISNLASTLIHDTHINNNDTTDNQDSGIILFHSKLNGTAYATTPYIFGTDATFVDAHTTGDNTIGTYFGEGWTRYSDSLVEPIRYVPRLVAPYNPTTAVLQ